MTGRFFDVAVITEGLNGLLAAYELSKADVSIVVIDNYKPSLEIDGYIFDYYPQHIFSYYELPDLLRQLHGVFETYTSPAFQLILPDRRIDISSDGKRCISDVNKRFKGKASGFTEYISEEQILLELLLKLKETEADRSGMM
jgi:phytoene dehydrogenase-like protein